MHLGQKLEKQNSKQHWQQKKLIRKTWKQVATNKSKPKDKEVHINLELHPSGVGKSYSPTPAGKSIIDAMQTRGLIRFKEHFIGMFETMDKPNQKEVLCELIKRV